MKNRLKTTRRQDGNTSTGMCLGSLSINLFLLLQLVLVLSCLLCKYQDYLPSVQSIFAAGISTSFYYTPYSSVYLNWPICDLCSAAPYLSLYWHWSVSSIRTTEAHYLPHWLLYMHSHQELQGILLPPFTVSWREQTGYVMLNFSYGHYLLHICLSIEFLFSDMTGQEFTIDWMPLLWASVSHILLLKYCCYCLHCYSSSSIWHNFGDSSYMDTCNITFAHIRRDCREE